MNNIGQVNYQSVQNNSSIKLTSSILINTSKTSLENNSDSVSLSSASLTYHEKEIARKYSLPSWVVDYMPPSKILNLNGVDEKAIAEGGRYAEMQDAASADGKITPAERRAINSYWNNMTANQQVRDRNSFNIAHSKDLDEYGKIYNEAYFSAKASLGIDENKVFNDFSVSESTNEAVHQKFKELLFSNARTKPLMDILGINSGA